MSYYPNVDGYLRDLQTLTEPDRSVMLDLLSTSGKPGEVFAADVFICRELIDASHGDVTHIDERFRNTPRWHEPLGDSTWGKQVVAAAMKGFEPAAQARDVVSTLACAAGSQDPSAPPKQYSYTLNGRRLRPRRADSLKGRKLEWLVPGRFAFGCVHVLDGDPGRGKSTIVFDIAARLSRGLPMPQPIEPPTEDEPRKSRRGKRDDESADNPAADAARLASPSPSPPPRCAAIIISAEDNDETAIQPRLVAAGADLSRIDIMDEVETIGPEGQVGDPSPIMLPDDIPLIEQRIRSTGARLLIIDPLMAFLGHDRRGRRIDPNREQSIRHLFFQLRKLAERTGCCIILIRHLSKSLVASALRRGLSSIGITAASRIALLVAEHPERPGVISLAGVKTNLGSIPPTINYRILKNEDGNPRVEWLDECDYSADDLLRRRAPEGDTPTLQREAEAFLKELLKEGPVPAADVLARGAERGLGRGTLDRAARGPLRVERFRKGKQWAWGLPIDELAQFEPLELP